MIVFSEVMGERPFSLPLQLTWSGGRSGRTIDFWFSLHIISPTRIDLSPSLNLSLSLSLSLQELIRA